MKILHVITAIQKAAGTSVFCCELCNGLARLGHEVTIAVSVFGIKEWYKTDPRVRIVSMNDIINWCDMFDVVHMHGLWQIELHHFAKWVQVQRIPMVWSTHGSLTRWAFRYKLWKKLPAWWLYQKKDLQRATRIHVTAESEISDVRRVGLTNKIVIAPLGVDLSGKEIIAPTNRRHRKILFVGRVAPIKGLENLLRAYAALGEHKNNIAHDWRIIIIGPDQEGHATELKRLARELGIEGCIEFLGAKFGQELHEAYMNADILVLPSYSENFGSVVVEALSHGTPVIATKGTPWGDLEDWRCGWWIDIGVQPLIKALTAGMSLNDAQRREMGLNGLALVENKYTWDAIVRKLLGAYNELLVAR